MMGVWTNYWTDCGYRCYSWDDEKDDEKDEWGSGSYDSDTDKDDDDDALLGFLIGMDICDDE